MTYDIVYDVSLRWPETWSFIAGGVVSSAVGAIFVFAPALRDRLLPFGVQGRARTLFSWVFFLFALLWTGAVASFSLPAHLRYQAAVRDGTCRIAEGVVQGFRPGDANRKPEQFTVQGVRIFYSDNSITGGFNKTQGGGGPLRDGQWVRICYLPNTGDPQTNDNVILRLEIAKTGS
ncbi:MAG TPA: hypothetical protein DCL54_07820 [Alphaproteobacteria bacterium]|nr:hypothetical protein [Alphaproteobacteria bacterium]HAJ46471.1 hypothetical protein [Alphaproteobacteria bacterium]